MSMKITLIPLLRDNYGYLLQTDDGKVAVVDPSEAGPVSKLLEDKGLALDYVFNTHHHHDHIGGNAALKKTYGCRIAAPLADANRIPDVDIGLSEQETFKLGSETVQIIETPGHTSGHICLYFPDSRALFCGDTLFSMGCGRLFEGSAEQMWDSLSKIMALPEDTMIYCGHEYTQANGDFCLTIEPDNKALQERMKEVERLRTAGKPTIPVSLDSEKQTNAFLRAGSAKRFGEIRRMKDAA